MRALRGLQVLQVLLMERLMLTFPPGKSSVAMLLKMCFLHCSCSVLCRVWKLGSDDGMTDRVLELLCDVCMNDEQTCERGITAVL